ncbi:MAG TPA: hypothetical protein DEP07_18790 [Brevibacillus sp.]|nr:hypothetical protein [Brevibacillus sp.]
MNITFLDHSKWRLDNIIKWKLTVVVLIPTFTILKHVLCLYLRRYCRIMELIYNILNECKNK